MTPGVAGSSAETFIVRVADEAALSTAFLYFWLATPAFSAHVEPQPWRCGEPDQHKGPA